MKAELETIDEHLYLAQTDLTWQNQGCLEYICQVKDIVYKMERKLQKSKDNVEIIKGLMKGWSKQPVFCRKDSKKDTLLMLEDRAAQVAKKYGSIRKDGETIHNLLQVGEYSPIWMAALYFKLHCSFLIKYLVFPLACHLRTEYLFYLLQENKSLYTADDGSEAWKQYVEYVDKMVIEGFFYAVAHSLEFFFNNMDGSVRQAPLLEAQMMLSESEIVLRPSLDIGAADGLYGLVEGLLQDVFQMSTQIKRVAPHLDMKDYQVNILFLKKK